jgi:aconitase A
MTTEWGALTGLFPVDDKTIQWYADRLVRWHRRKASTATATARSPLERVTEADLRSVLGWDNALG